MCRKILELGAEGVGTLLVIVKWVNESKHPFCQKSQLVLGRLEKKLYRLILISDFFFSFESHWHYFSSWTYIPMFVPCESFKRHFRYWINTNFFHWWYPGWNKYGEIINSWRWFKYLDYCNEAWRTSMCKYSNFIYYLIDLFTCWELWFIYSASSWFLAIGPGKG